MIDGDAPLLSDGMGGAVLDIAASAAEKERLQKQEDEIAEAKAKAKEWFEKIKSERFEIANSNEASAAVTALAKLFDTTYQHVDYEYQNRLSNPDDPTSEKVRMPVPTKSFPVSLFDTLPQNVQYVLRQRLMELALKL